LVDTYKAGNDNIKKPTGNKAVVNHIVVPAMIRRDLQQKGFLQLLQGGLLCKEKTYL